MPPSKQEQLIEAAEDLIAAKEMKSIAEGRVKELSDRVMDLMDVCKVDHVNTDVGKLSIVESSTLQIDEAMLKKKIGAKMWEKISRRLLDKKLLEDRIAIGEIDPTVVAGCATEVPRSRYLRSGSSATPKPTTLTEQIKSAKPQAVPTETAKPGKRRKQTRGGG
jgi:hypothetical protein